VEEESCKSEGNTGKSYEHAAKPIRAALGEKRDRADDTLMDFDALPREIMPKYLPRWP
jgi:hypothetical protein